MKHLLLTAILMYGMTATTPAAAQDGFDDAWAGVEAFYRQQVADSGIVGSSLVFVRGGDVLAEAYHGYADLATERRVDARTIYHWASITKTLTGIAVLQLRDRGLLSLDDPLTRYLPELRAVHNPYGSMDDVTLRHVMMHAAGFRAPTWPWGGGEDWHPHEPAEWSQLVAMMPYTRLHFAPGERYSYSNPGIIFLGRIVEQLTGDDIEVYLDKNVLKPLGMYASYFDRTPYHLLPYRSNNYDVVDGEAVANGLDFDTGITVSNGGLNAPLTDMARYLAFLIGEPGNAAYEGVLKRSSLEEMWPAQYPVAQRGDYAESVGLVFHRLDGKGLSVVGHTGSQKAFRAFFYVDPAGGTGVVAAFNTAGAWRDGRQHAPDTRALMDAVRARLFDDVFPLFRNNR